MPESLIDHIRRHTTIEARNDAADAAQAVAEWLDRRSRSGGPLAIVLRPAARYIQDEVDREEGRPSRAPADCRTRRRCPIPDDPCGPGGARPYCWEEDR